jgi:hypothetical protein
MEFNFWAVQAVSQFFSSNGKTKHSIKYEEHTKNLVPTDEEVELDITVEKEQAFDVSFELFSFLVTPVFLV